jgi:hypothetical protein
VGFAGKPRPTPEVTATRLQLPHPGTRPQQPMPLNSAPKLAPSPAFSSLLPTANRFQPTRNSSLPATWGGCSRRASVVPAPFGSAIARHVAIRRASLASLIPVARLARCRLVIVVRRWRPRSSSAPFRQGRWSRTRIRSIGRDADPARTSPAAPPAQACLPGLHPLPPAQGALRSWLRRRPA